MYCPAISFYLQANYRLICREAYIAVILAYFFDVSLKTIPDEIGINQYFYGGHLAQIDLNCMVLK
jgi:hypothetical protein